MQATLDPLVSEFETAEKAKAYDEWFRKGRSNRFLKSSGRPPTIFIGRR